MKATKNGAAARPAMTQRNATRTAAPSADATQRPAAAVLPAAPALDAAARPARGRGNGKAVFSIRLAPPLLEKARNACFFTPGLTLAALTETALTAELSRMETERGRPFETRSADIPRGRPIV